MYFKQDVRIFFLLSQNFAQSPQAEEDSDKYLHRKWTFNNLEGFNKLEWNQPS